MWPCRHCHEFNDNKLTVCNNCGIPKDSKVGTGVKWNVIYHFTENEDGPQPQITLAKGDIITINHEDGDWFKGKLGPQEGWIPKTCVEEEKIKTAIRYNVIQSHSVNDDYQINADEGDIVTLINRRDGYLWVSHEGNEGWIPESKVELSISDKDLIKDIPSQKQFKEFPADKLFEKEMKATFKEYRFRAKCAYKPEQKTSNIIELKEGDIGTITKTEENGWCEGYIGNEIGLIPAAYVEQIKEPPEELKVLAVYDEGGGDFIKPKINDIVLVLNKRNNWWLWVQCGEQVGWYPANYLTKEEDMQPPDPMRIHQTQRLDVRETKSDIHYNAPYKPDYDSMQYYNDKPPVLPKRMQRGKSSIVPQTEPAVYSNTQDTPDYSNQEYNNESTKQSSSPIGLGDFVSKQLVGKEDDSQEKSATPPPLPARRKAPPVPNKRNTINIPSNTYGNTDVPPVLEYEGNFNVFDAH